MPKCVVGISLLMTLLLGGCGITWKKDCIINSRGQEVCGSTRLGISEMTPEQRIAEEYEYRRRHSPYPYEWGGYGTGFYPVQGVDGKVRQEYYGDPNSWLSQRQRQRR